MNIRFFCWLLQYVVLKAKKLKVEKIPKINWLVSLGRSKLEKNVSELFFPWFSFYFLAPFSWTWREGESLCLKRKNLTKSFQNEHLYERDRSLWADDVQTQDFKTVSKVTSRLACQTVTLMSDIFAGRKFRGLKKPRNFCIFAEFNFAVRGFEIIEIRDLR